MKNYVLLISLHADCAMPPGGNEEWGGTHTYMRELLEVYEKYQVPCILITRKALSDLPPVEHYKQYCKIYRIISGGSDGPIDKKELYKYHETHLKQIQEIISKQDSIPSALHSVYWNSGKLAIALSSIYKMPFVHSVISNTRGRNRRGATPSISIRDESEVEVFQAAEKILCVSEDEKNDLVDLYHLNKEKIIVAGQYIDNVFLSPTRDKNGFPKLFSTISSETQQKISQHYNPIFETTPPDLSDENNYFWNNKAFTYLGRIHEDKGIIQIICAWSQLQKQYPSSCPPLWIIGGNIQNIRDIRLELLPFIPHLSKLEKERKIIWWGYLDTPSISTLFLKTEALLMHSLYEPGGRVVVEAMSSRVPVIATNLGFAKDYVKNWETGFILEHNDIETLKRRMEHFIRNPFLHDALGENSYQVALKIIEAWDFDFKHIDSYKIQNTLDKSHTSVHTADFQDYFKHRHITMFPVYQLMHSDYMIESRLKHNTPKLEATVINTPLTNLYSSHVYCLSINQTNEEVFAKNAFSRLALSPFFNPLNSQCFFRSSDESYLVEKSAYLAEKPPFFITYDDECQLIYTKKVNLISKDEISINRCIDYIMNKKNTLSKKDKTRYLRTINLQPHFENIQDFQVFFTSLNDSFPHYYFEVSCMFNENLAWELAPYLLSYNHHLFQPRYIDELEQIIKFWSKILFKYSMDNLQNISTDLELKHLGFFNKDITMIDLEKNSIGVVENDIAAFLFDCYLNEIIAVTDLVEHIPKTVDLHRVFSGFTYRLFYKIIIDSVMYSPSDKNLSDLILLSTPELLNK